MVYVIFLLLISICLFVGSITGNKRQRNGTEIAISVLLIVGCITALSMMLYEKYGYEYYITIKNNGNELERKVDKIKTDDEWLYYDYEGRSYMIDKRNVEIRVEKKKWQTK